MHQALNDNQINSIIGKLWSPLANGSKPNVFMILDCARDKRMEPLINKANIEKSCLYSGNLNYKLKRAAPHIVKLTEESAFTAKVLREGWGKSWGIILLTEPTIPMKTVRANCKRLAKVTNTNGKNLFFRYYDPRVLRKMLPVCNSYEIDCILGDSISLVTESEDELGLTFYQRGNEDTPLVINNLAIGDQQQCFINAAKKNPAHTWRNFLQLRQEHIDALQNKINDEEFSIIKDDFIECYIADSVERSLLFNVDNNDINLNAFLRICFDKAKEFNLDNRDSILNFINLNKTHGWKFWTKSEYKWVEDILHSNRPAEAKTEAISKEFSRILMTRMWS